MIQLIDTSCIYISLMVALESGLNIWAAHYHTQRMHTLNPMDPMGDVEKKKEDGSATKVTGEKWEDFSERVNDSNGSLTCAYPIPF